MYTSNVLTSIRYALALGLCAVLFAACDGLDSRFQEINDDPTSENDINVEFQLTGAQLKSSGDRFEQWRANLIYSSTMIQHFATLPTYWAGDKYLYIASYSSSFFDRRYTGAVKEIVDIVDRTAENPEDVNKNAIARIMRVLIFSRITDLYGDVPYSEAGKGFIEGIGQPKYDEQQAIYDDMFAELDAAVNQFDASQPTFGSGDLFYGGNIEQWRRFANSLRLRLALRLVKVNPQKAQEEATAAVNADGGVMTSNDDIAYIEHTDGPAGINRNGNGQVFSVDGSPRLSDAFVSWMDSRNDPRLTVYGTIPVGGAPAVGLPNGYDDSGSNPIQNHASWIPCEPADNPPSPCGMDVYMQPNSLIQGEDDPMFYQTYAEVEFMLAEAAVRWGGPFGDAETHYNNGVRAAMSYLDMYGSDGQIDPSAIDTYLANNPFNAGGTMAEKLEQINNQYWAAVLLNEYEAFANWRRTGYPDLVPTDYQGNVTNGTIPRRLRYPQSEAVQNKANYDAAIQRQGPDRLDTPMWWDCGATADQCNTTGLGSGATPPNS